MPVADPLVEAEPQRQLGEGEADKVGPNQGNIGT